jgi:hypothetical protein
MESPNEGPSQPNYKAVPGTLLLPEPVATASRGEAETLEAIGNPRWMQVREAVWAGEAGT